MLKTVALTLLAIIALVGILVVVYSLAGRPIS
jgi:hypothetical protein